MHALLAEPPQQADIGGAIFEQFDYKPRHQQPAQYGGHVVTKNDGLNGRAVREQTAKLANERTHDHTANYNMSTNSRAETTFDTTAASNEDVVSLAAEIRAMKGNLMFLNHQMMKLMKSFDVKRCDCSCCDDNINEDIRRNGRKRGHLELKKDLSNETKHMRLASNDATRGGVNEIDSKQSMSPTTSVNDSEEPEEEALERDENASPQSTGNDWSLANGGADGKLNSIVLSATATAAFIGDEAETLTIPKRGRKSKYCSASEKRAVAGYAQTYGATAAARKFNIPPAVAAYYHRKQFKSPKSLGVVNEEAAFFPESFNGAEYTERIRNGIEEFSAGVRTPSTAPACSSSSVNTTSVKNLTKDGALAQASGHSSPLSDAPTGSNLFEANHQNNNSNGETEISECGVWGSSLDKGAAHSSSPGFLRGRGRGRPKLIGDELDAELVEYMVQLKAANRHHLTASQALQIARAYIADKSPGLLEEHGGQIKLKITWAMKLVSRIGEREREIQLGLPAGSLQNLGRNSTTIAAKQSSTEDFIHQQSLIVQQAQGINGLKNDFQVSPRSTVTSATDTTQWPTSANAMASSSTMTTLLSALGKFSADQLNGTTAAASDLFDADVLLAELGINNLEELAQCEPFKSLLQASLVNASAPPTATGGSSSSSSSSGSDGSDAAKNALQVKVSIAANGNASPAEMLITSAF